VSDVDELWRRLRSGERAALARAITWAESGLDAERMLASELVQRAAREPAACAVWRIGVTGPPGVGKSTLLDALGTMLVERGLRPAVLAIDPSSGATGGSLLGDQTRMGQLVAQGAAFVRPTATRGHLGGAGASTWETALLCAAAGYGPILVETVGVGQSEVEVSFLVDLVVLLLQPGAGDELQGMKRGILEHADLVVVSQADGERRELAERTRDRFEGALKLTRGHDAPGVRLASSLEGRGIDELWDAVSSELSRREASGDLAARRREQEARALRPRLVAELERVLGANPACRRTLSSFEAAVRAGALTLPEAVEQIFKEWRPALEAPAAPEPTQSARPHHTRDGSGSGEGE
jgi:LAO/AO transport system kinase